MSTIYRQRTPCGAFQLDYAQREDGAWFRRLQHKDEALGWRWTPWVKVDFQPVLKRAVNIGQNARLPKE